MASSEGSFPKI